jgi:O-antigen ligase
MPRILVGILSPTRVSLSELFAPVIAVPEIMALTVNSYETRLAMLRLACYVIVFLVAYEAYRSNGKAAGLVGTLVGVGIFEAIWGCIQYLTGWQYIFWYKRSIYSTEATGTYVNHNHFAGLLEMVLPFLLAGLLLRGWPPENARRSPWIELIVSPSSSRLLRDLVLFATICVALVFSRSRMGIMAATLGILLVAAIAFFERRRKSMLVIFFVVLSLPAAYSIWIGVTPVIERFKVLLRPGALEADRLPVWRDTIALIRDYPLLGTGLGTYRWANGHYQTSMFWGIYEHAHNDYLEFASDIGIPATVLLFGSLWVLVLRVARRAQFLDRSRDKILAAGCAGAMAAILIHGITDFNLQIPANAYLFSWIAGTAAALVRRPPGATSDARADRIERRHDDP